ncbi:hypothetical protein KPL71_001451 [Citrus sinensis]|uniref:Uncharacterized protein n=1 Tax=Citrus sinensis TaxID=2711 RepID=A0ACB8NYZ6_CITSI|nr:hypothetical protein KPL71_001451 [Citrus sinensis]
MVKTVWLIFGLVKMATAILTKPKINHTVLTMDPIHCRTSSFSSSSSGKTSDSKHVVSSEEFFIENFDKAIDCWELPKISKEKIYKTKKLDFLKNDYIIKTEERDITLSKPFETIHLFSEHSLKKLKEKNFNYVHIGLIQVGIKPLTKEGLDTSILAILRDGRFISFDDSLLSSIESSLCKGHISFDCYPNITISLKDKNILKSMILQIKTHNYNMIEGSIPVALIFKISYKAMITAFSTQHKFQSKRDETLLLQTDLSRANTVIPKPIQWKDVHLPEEWILEGAAPPAIPKQLEPNTELQNVTQYSDGRVKLSFRRSTSSRFSDKASCSSIPSLERKFTKVPSVINLPFQSQPRFSTSDIPSTSIRSVDYTTSVPHPIYTSNQHIQSQEEKEPSPPTSPTFSAVTENVISVIEKEFELDKTLLHNDFYSDLNKEKRLWFFKHFLNQRKEIQQSYYEFVNLHKVHILFFDWFEIYSSNNNISYPFKESNPITIRKKTTEWKLSESNRTVDSEHPPLRSITVDHGEPPIDIRASPYKIPKPNDTDRKQLTRIENQFQQSTISVSPSQKPIPPKSDSDKKLKEPIFKPFQVSKTSQRLVQESKSDFAKAIREQLDRIEAASSSSSKAQIAPDTPQSSKIGILDKTQLQRFLGSLNYVLDFCPNINRMSEPLHDRLKKKHVPWTDEHTKVIMPPKKNKGKAVLKDTGSQEPSKEPQSTPSKEKLLSSAMPIKSWIEMVEEHGAQYKSISSDDQDSQVILQRTFKVKWWSKFDEQSKLTVNMIKDWLSSKNLLQPSLTTSKVQQTFLTQKSKAQSLLAGAKTEDEYFKAMEQLLASRSKSSVADTSEDEDEDEDEDEPPENTNALGTLPTPRNTPNLIFLTVLGLRNSMTSPTWQDTGKVCMIQTVLSKHQLRPQTTWRRNKIPSHLHQQRYVHQAKVFKAQTTTTFRLANLIPINKTHVPLRILAAPNKLLASMIDFSFDTRRQDARISV